MPTGHQKVKGILAFLLCIVLNGCTGMPTVLPTSQTPQIIATSTPEKLSPTNLPATLQPSPTITLPTPQRSSTYIYSIESIRTPSATPGPSVTPAASWLTDTALLNSQATLTQQAFDLRDNPSAGFSITCDDSEQNNTSLSPGGNWLAISCGYSLNQQLEIVSKKGQRWMLKLVDFLPAEFVHDGTTGNGGLYPRHWTDDEKYLYFSSYIGWEGGGTCFYGFGDAGLYRINLNDGTIATVLPTSPSGYGYEITFAPGGRRLAYTYAHLVILDLKTGEESTL